MSLSVDELIERERACGVMFGPFWQHKYLERAPEAVRRSLHMARQHPRIRAARDTMQTPIKQEFPNFSGIAAVTATTETNLWDPSIWSPIPMNDASPGCGYVLSFGGIYSNRTTTTPASTWAARWGQNNSAPPTGTLLGTASNAVYMGAATTNKPFFGEVTVSIRAVGATGTAAANGFVTIVSDTVTARVTSPFGGAVTTIDTTANAGIGISHIWSAANASNTLTAQWAVLQAYN